MYQYECVACQHENLEFQFMKDPHLTECPACGAAAYERRPTLPHSDMVEFHKPIEMYSIALNSDEEIRAFQEKCPDVQVSADPRDDMYGVPIARTRKDKLSAMAAMGYEESK